MSLLENPAPQVQATQGYSFLTRLLLWAGAVGPLLFVVVLLIEGATRPGYSAWHNFGSSLSLGDQGWMQITNFIVCGLLTFGFAVGLRQMLRAGKKGSVWGPVLLGLFSLSLISAGLFVTDPGLGYPPGVPTPADPTWHNIIHGLSGLVVFISLPAATFVMIRRFAGDPAWRGWALYSLLTGLLMIASFLLFQVLGTMDQNGTIHNAPIGFVQRIAIIAGWVWISLLAIAFLRKERAPAVAGSVPR